VAGATWLPSRRNICSGWRGWSGRLERLFRHRPWAHPSRTVVQRRVAVQFTAWANRPPDNCSSCARGSRIPAQPFNSPTGPPDHATTVQIPRRPTGRPHNRSLNSRSAPSVAVDAILLVRARDNEDLRHLILDRIQAMEGVQNTRTLLVVDEPTPLRG
jgi:hypothetical protein